MRLALTLIAISTCSCGSSDPVDVRGEYSLALTNGPNDCAFADWQAGEQTTGVEVSMTQDDRLASATVEGAAGVFVAAILGTGVFTGDVDGSRLGLGIVGTRSFDVGECRYTLNAELDATLSGDALAGAIEYRPATNGHVDCGALNDCANRQEFNGARPPASQPTP